MDFSNACRARPAATADKPSPNVEIDAPINASLAAYISNESEEGVDLFLLLLMFFPPFGFKDKWCYIHHMHEMSKEEYYSRFYTD